MKKSTIARAVALAIGTLFAVRARTQDIAYGFRMPAGFPGDVNRTHPASILPGLVNTSVQAPRLFGDAVIIDSATNSYRGVTAADTATFAADGVAVRPYPTQQTTGGMTSTIGTGVPSVNQPIDVLNDGYIMVKCNVGTPQKNGAVYVYTGTSTGNHVQGGFEAASGSNLTLVSNMRFNGPPDASGVTEAVINRVGV